MRSSPILTAAFPTAPFPTARSLLCTLLPIVATLALCAGCSGPAATQHVAEVTEAKHPKLDGGERCAVHVRTAYKFGLNCRISVVCAGHQLYGGHRLGGYASCETDDANRTTFSLEDNPSSKDGDPAIALDVTKGTVRVWDGRWSVSAKLVGETTPDGKAFDRKRKRVARR